ncbi:MAG: Ig-like domain-containing protein [Candidatus Woykebacteria bacterium]
MSYKNLLLLLLIGLPILFPPIVSAQDVDVGATVDREPPTINITSPLDGSTVSEIVNVTTSVGDDAGIDKVEFYVDGFLKLTDSSAPYSFSWDSGTVGNGSHIIRARVYDIVGKTAQDSITVTVNNSTTPASPPPAIETPTDDGGETPEVPATQLRRVTLIQDPLGYLEQETEKGLLFGLDKDALLGFIVAIQLAIILLLLYLLKHLRSRRSKARGSSSSEPNSSLNK